MYNLKIIQSGGRIELYKINNYLIREGKKVDVLEGIFKIEEEKIEILSFLDEPKEEIEKEPDKAIRKKTLNIARNKIIRLIKSNEDMQTFITLTFAAEQDFKSSKKSLDKFFHKLRRNHKDLKYLWVLEYGGTKGRLHYHMLTNLSFKIKLSNSTEKKTGEHKQLEQEFATRYWPFGFVDIRQLKTEGNTNIALYVSTYIVKSFEDMNLEGYRVYGYSQKTLEKPKEYKVYTNSSIEEILRQYKEYEITYANSYAIGYSDYKGDHKGSVSYFDMKLKEC